MAVMAPDDVTYATLTSGGVADVAGVSQDSVYRLGKAQLDYWTTLPDGKGQRRYRVEDAIAYARSLGRSEVSIQEVLRLLRESKRLLP